MNIKLLTLASCFLLFPSCQGQQQKEKDVAKNTKQFEMVAVPSMITEPEDRAKFVVNHYWDKYDFTDTTNIHIPELTEQALSNYIELLKFVTPEVASSSIKQMMNNAAKDSIVFDYFAKQYEKYLYDPNSPMRNESLYIYVLQSVLQEPVYDEVNKIRPQSLLDLAMKNRPGMVANDFVYTMEGGKTSKLSQLKADNVILFFYNPDCEACKKTSSQIASSQVINNSLASGKVKLLAVYPDEDVEAWKNHTKEIPSDWINSYDDGSIIKNDELYDTKAIPTLILLDKDKKVLIKDGTFEEIESFFMK